jgi:hypothetical protein
MSMEVTLEKLGKRSDRSLAQEPCKKRPTVDAYAQVSASPQHRDKSTTIHGSDIQTAAGRWLGEIHLVLLSLLHEKMVMRLPRMGTFCRHDRDWCFRC